MLHCKKYILVIFILILAVILVFSIHQHNEPAFNLKKSNFSQLPHWEQDNHNAALTAFTQSCKEILQRKSMTAFGADTKMGTVNHWQTICHAANELNHPNDKTARQFFETWFQPYSVTSSAKKAGLFTGYYVPELHANLKRNQQYTTPIYGLPNDLIKVNLASFHVNGVNKTLIGQLQKDRLAPYPDRAAINNGAIDKQTPILAWTDDPINLFFAQIQGSVFLILPHQKKILLGYAGANGRPYTAIGKILIANHTIDKSNISMQSIRAWLEQHPDQINTILNHNASYVFFKALTIPHPIGNEGVPLTPGRSLAVDNHYIPLGTPIWLDTVTPTATKDKFDFFQRLVIAQDTGGAIKGAIRGDVYWGTGDTATFLAGHMQSPGQYWILLPR